MIMTFQKLESLPDTPIDQICRMAGDYGLPDISRSYEIFHKVITEEATIPENLVSNCPKKEFWNLPESASSLYLSVINRKSYSTIAITLLIAIAFLATAIAIPILAPAAFLIGTLSLTAAASLGTGISGYCAYTLIKNKMLHSKEISIFNEQFKTIQMLLNDHGSVIKNNIEKRLEVNEYENSKNQFSRLQEALEDLSTFREFFHPSDRESF